MVRRRNRRKSLKSTTGLKRRKNKSGNFFLNSSVAVLTLLVFALGYSWAHRQFIAKDDSSVLLTLPDEATTLTSKMWMEKKYRDIKVEVLNGIGIDGIAAEVTEYLRDKGFDVVKTDDAGRTDYIYSMVKDRTGNLGSARNLAEILNIDTLSVLQEINKSLILDATVILGKDYIHLAPFNSKRELP